MTAIGPLPPDPPLPIGFVVVWGVAQPVATMPQVTETRKVEARRWGNIRETSETN